MKIATYFNETGLANAVVNYKVGFLILKQWTVIRFIHIL